MTLTQAHRSYVESCSLEKCFKQINKRESLNKQFNEILMIK